MSINTKDAIILIWLGIYLQGCGNSKSNESATPSLNIDTPTNIMVPKQEIVLDTTQHVQTYQTPFEAEIPEVKEVDKKPVITPPRKYARIQFDSIVHALPDIHEGEKFKYSFKFRNAGKIPLTIQSVTPSCGCTMPSYPFLDIAEGDKGEIGVTYNSVGKDGPQSVELIVAANTFPKKTVLKMNFSVLPKKVRDVNPEIDSLSN